MNLFSPARGVLVFLPIVLVSLWGIVLAWRRRWRFPLSLYLSAILFAHVFFIAPYWPAHSYGPRSFADMSPLFVFFLIPAILHWSKMTSRYRVAAGAAFLAMALCGVFLQARGATSVTVRHWNILPVNVDADPQRVWDWHGPQFLRGLH